jgi:hypothetical protein
MSNDCQVVCKYDCQVYVNEMQYGSLCRSLGRWR